MMYSPCSRLLLILCLSLTAIVGAGPAAKAQDHVLHLEISLEQLGLHKTIETGVKTRGVWQLQELHDYVLDMNAKDIAGNNHSITYHIILRRLIDEWNSCCGFDTEGFLNLWEREYPNSPIPKMLRARLEIRKFVTSVLGGTRRDNPLIQHWLTTAKTIIDADRWAFEQNPAGYEAMITLEMMSTWDTGAVLALADAALSKFPDESYMLGIAVQFGDEDFLIQIAELAEKHDGDAGYATAMTLALLQPHLLSIYLEQKVDWEKMVSGMDIILTRYPQSNSIEAFFTVSCLYGDDIAAMRYLKYATQGQFEIPLDADICEQVIVAAQPESGPVDESILTKTY